MNPLIELESGKTHPDIEEHTLNWWSDLLDLSPSTIAAALYKGCGKVLTPDKSGWRKFKIELFPKLIEGLQKTGERPDGHHYHEWALGVDTTAPEFTVTTKTGKILNFFREDAQIILTNNNAS